ncbi:MAG: tripartite tricarboxylate transporter substrate binding protein [Rubrivivax sp.]
MNRRQLLSWSWPVSLWPAAAAAATPPPAPLQCVVPAKPGGGFDVTCQLVRDLLAAPPGPPVIVYHPGGIGALTYSEVVRGQRPHARELLAFSSGTLLNLAQGRFGAWRPDRIRWVAGLAMDHGVVAVHPESPWRTLGQLLEALRVRPSSVAFAAGGTIGSQDWMKAALLARAAGVSHKSLRVVAFEGGGDALRALQGRHVQVLCGDAGELSAAPGGAAGTRLLAVLSPQRLTGALASVPTAIEQGFDVSWPILRGVYTSVDYPAAELATVVDEIARALRSPEHGTRVRARGLQPLALTGVALAQEVDAQWVRLAELAREFGVTVRR